MSAQLHIVKITGPAANKVFTQTTTLNFGTKDIPNPNVPGTPDYSPIARPTTGFSYSFWLSASLRENTGNFTDVRNIRVFFTAPATPWPLGTGGDVLIGNRNSGDIGCPQANYQQATGIENETGHYIAHAENGHAYYKGQTTPVKSWNDFVGESNMVMLDSGPYTAAFVSKSAVMQIKVAPNAEAKSLTGWQITFRFQYVG